MLFSFAWKELTRRKTRTALTVLGTFFAIALMTSVLAIAQSIGQTVSLPFQASGADMVVQTMEEPGPWTKFRLARHLGPIPSDVLTRIRSLPEVASVSGQLHLWSWWKPKMIAVAGIDPAGPAIGPISTASGKGQGNPYIAIKGRMLQPDDRYAAFVDKKFADKLGFSIGSEIPIGTDKFRVVGLGDFQDITRVAQAEIFIPLSTAQMLMEKGEIVNILLIKLKNAQYLTKVERKITDIMVSATGLDRKAIKTFTSSTVLPEVAGISLLAQSMIKIVSLIVIVGVILLVIKTSLMAVAERIGEIGILKAVGWKNGEVARLIMIENFLQGLIGGLAGCLAGYAIAGFYISSSKMLLPTGMNPYPCVPAVPAPLDLASPFGVSPALIGLSLVVAIGIGTVSGWMASRRAATLEPVQALRRI